MRKNINILLVDDSYNVREAIKTVLAFSDHIHITDIAENGAEAVQKVTEKKFDLIIMDIDMPVLNGIEATMQILKKYPDTQILAFSIHDEESYQNKIIEAGAKDYVNKYAPLSSLISAIESIAASYV